jgi:hypothetical protein
MVIANLDYLESVSDLSIEGGKVKKLKFLNQATADAIGEAFGPFTFTSAISGTSTTLGSSSSRASSISISSNKPFVVF